MKQLYFGWLVVGGVIYGCSQTPNAVSLSATQGLCVTGIQPGYESSVTTYSQAFPLNANLPATSPYCVAVTITNNNSGQNANNIQVNGYGLTLTYTSTNGSVTTASLIDYNAAGVAPSSFSNTYQQVANLALFDPNNCVTTIGPNVNTLYTNGGNCTFYLELVAESMPIGVYPLNFAVNYTNGNANYSTGVTLNQRSNLYVGGNFNSNLVITNAQTTSPTANTFISANSPENYVVTALTRDAFGNVYSGDILGNVYRYTGESIASWTTISGLPQNTAIAAMTADNNGNVYLSNLVGAIYQVSPTAVTSMGYLTMHESQPISMQVLGNLLYVTNANNMYTCSLATINASSCNSGQPLNGPDSVINQLVSSGNTVNIAGATGVWQYNGGGWLSIPNSVDTGLPGTNVNSIAYFNNSSFSNSPYWYAGLTQVESTVSSVYIESNNAPFAALLSSSGQNIISGTVRQLVIDAGNGVFVGGSFLQSNDFVNQYAILAYLPSSLLTTVNSVWTPITGVSGTINVMQAAVQLTSY